GLEFRRVLFRSARRPVARPELAPGEVRGWPRARARRRRRRQRRADGRAGGGRPVSAVAAASWPLAQLGRALDEIARIERLDPPAGQAPPSPPAAPGPHEGDRRLTALPALVGLEQRR